MDKNNVTRLLDANNIVYSCHELPAEKISGVDTARILRVPPGLVYKTIVACRERGKPILAVIPAIARLDLKKVALFLSEKKIILPSEKDAEEITGLQVGGISPLALIHKGFQVLIESDVENDDLTREIHISGGRRGLNIRLQMKDLLRLTKAQLAHISEIGSEDQ